MNSHVGSMGHGVARFASIFVLSAVLSLLRFPPGDEYSAAAGTTRVTVRCTQPSYVAGLPLRVLTNDPLRKELMPVDERTPFGADGMTGVDLAPGTYVFEAASARDDGTVIVVQSEPVAVPETTSAVINASGPHELHVKHKGGKARIAEIGVRSAAAVGQTRWTRKGHGAMPRLVLTPGKSFNVNVLGNIGSTYIAAWVDVTVDQGRWPVEIQTAEDWNDCRFTLRSGTPPAKHVTARVLYPDCFSDIPLGGKPHLLTNRRFMAMGYRMELRDGPCLEFQPLPYNIAADQQWELGGAQLTPYAWSDYLWEQQIPNWFAYLVCVADLLDPDGHRLDVRPPKSGVTTALRRTDGKPMPTGRVGDEERKAIGSLHDGIRVKIDWTWNGSHSCELQPDAYIALSSPHCRIASLRSWKAQSQYYLSTVERYLKVEQEATGRPGPASLRLDWRQNTHDARAMVGVPGGGQQLLWCSMPFSGYENCLDPFAEPWFMGHEMLHTFGYNHDDTMTRLQQLVEFKFARYRWHLVDHPDEAFEIVKGVPEDEAKLADPKIQSDPPSGTTTVE